MRNQFIDPAGVVTTYDWSVNHEREEPAGRSRNITHTANTGNVGLVRQQGDREPYVMRLGGTILHTSQHDAMWAWYDLCDTQSIYFRDAFGTTYEVIISDFAISRVRKAKNPQDPGNAPLNVWEYTITLDVLRIVSGPLAGVVTP